MEITIDKGLPIPRAPRGAKYPLAQMDVGDSFFVPSGGNQSISGSFGILRPKRFSVRTVTENGIKGVRVWRIA